MHHPMFPFPALGYIKTRWRCERQHRTRPTHSDPSTDPIRSISLHNHRRQHGRRTAGPAAKEAGGGVSSEAPGPGSTSTTSPSPRSTRSSSSTSGGASTSGGGTRWRAEGRGATTTHAAHAHGSHAGRRPRALPVAAPQDLQRRAPDPTGRPPRRAAQGDGAPRAGRVAGALQGVTAA